MKREKVLVLSIVLGLLTAPVFAVSIPILKPGDSIIAIDADLGMNSRYPTPNETPQKVLDSNPATKYLNYGVLNSGFIVTPSVPASLVLSFTMTTANDAEERDPASWALYGTNAAIMSIDNSTGLAEGWTLIDKGAITLPSARQTLAPPVNITTPAPYNSYKMMYPTLKSMRGGVARTPSSMQLADIMFYMLPNGLGPGLLSPTDPILAVQVGDSRYPVNETPAKVIDGVVVDGAGAASKYLNFGKLNSGFIVTPSVGASVLDSFEVTTANDSPERDPATWMLYGTNAVITSTDNSDGAKEVWTLICGGTLTLPDTRNTLGSRVEICNQSTPYGSYKMVFPTVKNATAANSMQIAEIQFYGVPEPATVCLLGLGGLALLRRRRA